MLDHCTDYRVIRNGNTMAYFANQYTQPIGALGAYFANQYTQPINGLGVSPDGLGACAPCMAAAAFGAADAAPAPPSRLRALAVLAVPAAIGAGIGWGLGSKRPMRDAAIGAAVPFGVVALYFLGVAVTGRT